MMKNLIDYLLDIIIVEVELEVEDIVMEEDMEEVEEAEVEGEEEVEVEEWEEVEVEEWEEVEEDLED